MENKQATTIIMLLAFIGFGQMMGRLRGIKVRIIENKPETKLIKHLETKPVKHLESVVFCVTAYCPCEICCGKWADGITASGHVIQPGDKFVAAPADLFDFGDVIFVPGYGTVPVLDRGGAIKGKRIDVFFSTHQEALNWGVKHLTIRKAKK